MNRGWVVVAVAALSGLAGQLRTAEPDRGVVMGKFHDEAEKFWDKVQDPEKANPRSRDILANALILCENHEHPERLAPLLRLAAAMQDKDPASKTYGNFRWMWNAPKIVDDNAVDFCMESVSLLWLKDRDTMPAEAREILSGLVKLGIEGSLWHVIKPSYTNIGLLNARNLILLGEGAGRPEAEAEGLKRLAAVEADIAATGIHEYGSPTYYGIDAAALRNLEGYTTNDEARKRARTLLELLWTDVALNWFPPALRYGGPNSRSYDYLNGLGILDDELTLAGWLPEGGEVGSIFATEGGWQPLTDSAALSGRYPRLVEQSWGPGANQGRTHYVMSDVTLGVAGESYSNTDIPLTVDLPGPRTMPRCYLIADGRHDPQGKAKIEEKSGHRKSLHLAPFFAGTQRKSDALGLFIYRPADLPEGTATLESHFVMPAEVDGLFVNGKALEMKNEPWTVEIPLGGVIALRRGTAAVGVRVPWARASGGRPARVSLAYDGNPWKAMRLTVEQGIEKGPLPPEAAFWVRVGSQIATDEAFGKWLKEFSKAPAEVDAADKVSIRVAGTEGPMEIVASPPYRTAQITPPPPRAILAVDGVDVGKKILGLEPSDSQTRRSFKGPAGRGSQSQDIRFDQRKSRRLMG